MLSPATSGAQRTPGSGERRTSPRRRALPRPPPTPTLGLGAAIFAAQRSEAMTPASNHKKTVVEDTLPSRAEAEQRRPPLRAHPASLTGTTDESQPLPLQSPVPVPRLQGLALPLPPPPSELILPAPPTTWCERKGLRPTTAGERPPPASRMVRSPPPRLEQQTLHLSLIHISEPTRPY